MPHIRNPLTAACACCSELLHDRFDRRQFLHVAGGAGLALAFPALAFAAKKKQFEAMVLSCIDPRIIKPVRLYTTERGLKGQYSQFTIAGAAVGVVAPKFKKWHRAFWDNLGASIQLHSIKKVIAINHRDCGAAKLAYGKDTVATPQLETETHRAALTEFRQQVAQRHPQLGVETGLMALDGKMEMFS